LQQSIKEAKHAVFFVKIGALKDVVQ